MANNVTSVPIANIVRTEFITEENPAKVYLVDTASEATANVFLSAGTDLELRIKNHILAQNNTEDIAKGYDIAFNDATFSPELFALIDGGQSTVTSGGEFQNYNAPVAGKVVERTKAQMAVYSEEKDYNGDVLSYIRLVYPHAKGSPANVQIQDGQFYSPSYTLKSRPRFGESPLAMQTLTSLPEYAADVTDIDIPTDGSTAYFVATAELTFDQEDYFPGDLIVVPAE